MISPPSVVGELIEIPETDTSPVKTMTVLRISQPGITVGRRVSNKNAELVCCVQSSGDSYVKAYCSGKLRCLSEGELKSKAEVGEESFAQIFGGQSSISGAALIVRSGIEEVLEEGGPMHWNSTPVKTMIGSNGEVPVGMGSGKSPVKRSAVVAFRSDQHEETFFQEQSVRGGGNLTLVKTVH